MIGDKKSDIFGENYPIGVGFLQQDRDSHFQLGRFDANGQTPDKPRDQTVFDACDLFRIGITGDDDLLVSLDQRIESVEKFLLRAIFPVEKLNVVNQEQIERVVILFKSVKSLVL